MGSLIADDGATADTRFEAVNQGWVSITRPWHLFTTNAGSGYPHAASAEKGRRLMEMIVERLAPFLAELSAVRTGRTIPILSNPNQCLSTGLLTLSSTSRTRLRKLYRLNGFSRNSTSGSSTP